MPDSMMGQSDTEGLADIDGFIRQSHDEYARSRAIAVLL